MDARRPMGPADVFRNITEPESFQQCHVVSQKGRVSLGNLKCVGSNCSDSSKNKKYIEFTFVQHASPDKRGTLQTGNRNPLPQHDLEHNDKVNIQVHDEAGYRLRISGQQEIPGHVLKMDQCSIVVQVATSALTKYSALPGKYFSIQTPACQLKVRCCSEISTADTHAVGCVVATSTFGHQMKVTGPQYLCSCLQYPSWWKKFILLCRVDASLVEITRPSIHLSRGSFCETQQI